jgi:hypothetical protein
VASSAEAPLSSAACAARTMFCNASWYACACAVLVVAALMVPAPP